mgnify:CR=1 FL=1
MLTLLDILSGSREASGRDNDDGAAATAQARSKQRRGGRARGIWRAMVCLQRRGALILLGMSWMLDTRSIERVDGMRTATAGLLYVRCEETGGGLGHEL